MTFWSDHLAPTTPALPRADAVAYRAERGLTSASGIYAERMAAPQRGGIYVDSEYKGLGAYATAPKKSKFEQGGITPNESDFAYRERLKNHLNHLQERLDPEEWARVQKSYEAAVDRLNGGAQTHAQLRQQLDSRTSGTGVSLLPDAASRAQIIGGRGMAGEQVVQAKGHLAAQVESLAANRPASMFEIRAILDDQERRRLQPQRPAVPNGSTGEGWMVSRG